MSTRPIRLAVTALAIAVAACGGSTSLAGPSSPGTLSEAGAGNGEDEVGGAVPPANTGKGTEAGAAGNAACETKHDVPPGPAVVRLSQHGSGACADITLAEYPSEERRD